jgi:phosphate transport system permease protein
VKFDRFARRKFLSHAITVLAGLTVVAVLYPLVDLVYTAFVHGGAVLFQWAFLTSRNPTPCSAVSCTTVGIGPNIEGSFLIVGLASLISIPIGVMAAILASEYRTRGFGRAVSFTADVLTGVPSIIMGAFVYGYLVLEYPNLVVTALSGGLALSAIMIPIVARTTEEALRTVPNATREAAIALGISKWKMSMRIVFISALPGVVTGVLLAVMRAAGEAAPLLILTGNSTLWFSGYDRPAGTLPILIYQYALSSSTNWQQVAWGATLFLLIAILLVNIFSRYMIQRLSTKMSGGS